MNAIIKPVVFHTVEFQELTPYQYLLADVASSYGLDKKNWDERIDWGGQHENNLRRDLDRMRKDPNYVSAYLQEADEPALLFAGMQALEAYENGQPSGYAISLDATASVMQLLSVLCGCADSARMCNVIPSTDYEDNREDAYTNLYLAMKQLMESIQEEPEGLKIVDGDDEIIPEFEITRAQAKDAIMTAFYGSTRVPKKYFGRGEKLKAFYAVLETYTPGAWSLNLGLKNLWQPYAKSHDWVLPDNFHVHVKEMNEENFYVQFLNQPIEVGILRNQGTEEGLSLCPNIIHSIDGMVVREMVLRCGLGQGEALDQLEQRKGTDEDYETVKTLWHHYLASGFLSARILRYLSADSMELVHMETVMELIKTLPVKGFEIMTIHDCFRCLPNYGNDLRRQYNQILSALAKSEMLSFIASQVTGHPFNVIKASDLSKSILASNYSIC